MTAKEKLAATIESKAASNPGFAVAYALLKLADAQSKTAMWVKYLGGGDNASQMGAVEFLAVHLGKKIDRLASAIEYQRGDEYHVANPDTDDD